MAQIGLLSRRLWIPQGAVPPNPGQDDFAGVAFEKAEPYPLH
jgi:hypothetical protein